jgi:hypothetical protein
MPPAPPLPSRARRSAKPVQAASTSVRARCATTSVPPRPVPPTVSYRASTPVPSVCLAPVPRCPPRRHTLEPLPRPSGSLPSPSCHKLAQKGVRRQCRVCPAGAPAPLSSLPLPRARCSRQCLNHELHQSRPPKAQCYAPKVISLGPVHFRSFGLWHVGSHSPFRC